MVKRPVETGWDWSFTGLQIPRLWRTKDQTAVFGLLWSWEFVVLIGLGPIQSRSFSSYKTGLPNTRTDPTFPDHIIMSKSEEHPMIQDSASPPCQILFPVSDSELSDPMDVIRSNEQSAQPQAANTDSSIPDHINLPYNFPRPNNTRPSMAGFRHDPSTGRFTPASFANFPDDLVD